jgi:ferric-dicitrate binding protein FerR (iron transport regulator)
MKTRDESPKEESGAHRLAALLRNDATVSVDGERDQAQWQRLLLATHAEDSRPRPRSWRWWLLAPLTVGAALLAVGLLRGSWAPSPLRFTLDGRNPAADYLVSEAGRTRLVDFSDGSGLVMRSSTRLRVSDTDSHGAVLLLERGQLDASIRHRPASRWRLDVGPYTVHVIGTRFNVAWDPDRGDFGLALLDGVVAIRGPGIPAPITLEMGQQFHANKAGSYTVQKGSQAMLPAVSPPAPAPVAMPSKPERVAVAAGPERAASPSTSSRPACDWAALVSNGEFEATVSLARRLGIDTVLAECPPRSLFALADAARYLGKFELSKNALLTIRRRSPSDTSKAAFFLGRLEEARANLELALDFYAQAMAGNPEPHFAQEAKAGRARIERRMRGLATNPAPSAP